MPTCTAAASSPEANVGTAQQSPSTPYKKAQNDYIAPERSSKRPFDVQSLLLVQLQICSTSSFQINQIGAAGCSSGHRCSAQNCLRQHGPLKEIPQYRKFASTLLFRKPGTTHKVRTMTKGDTDLLLYFALWWSLYVCSLPYEILQRDLRSYCRHITFSCISTSPAVSFTHVNATLQQLTSQMSQQQGSEWLSSCCLLNMKCALREVP